MRSCASMKSPRSVKRRHSLGITHRSSPRNEGIKEGFDTVGERMTRARRGVVLADLTHCRGFSRVPDGARELPDELSRKPLAELAIVGTHDPLSAAACSSLVAGPKRTALNLDAEAKAIRDTLNTLQRSMREGYSPGTVLLIRPAILFDESLWADARRELQTAIEPNRSEPAIACFLAAFTPDQSLRLRCRRVRACTDSVRRRCGRKQSAASDR